MAKSIKMVRNHLTHHFTFTAPYGNDTTAYVMKPLTGTASLGFAYADGVDYADVPQNDKYFFADKDLGTKGRIRADGSDLVVLPKPANLILTCAAANTKESLIRFEVRGELVGNK